MSINKVCTLLLFGLLLLSPVALLVSQQSDNTFLKLYLPESRRSSNMDTKALGNELRVFRASVDEQEQEQELFRVEVAALDSLGDEKWVHLQDNSDTNWGLPFYSAMVVSSDSSTYVLTTDSLHPTIPNQIVLRVEKINYAGDLVWSKSYYDELLYVCWKDRRTVVPLKDGGLAIFGACDRDYFSVDERLYRLIINSDGELIDRHHYPSNMSINAIGGMVAQPFGEDQQIAIYVSPLDNNEESHLLRLNMNGDVLTHRYFNSRQMDQIVKLNEDEFAFLEYQSTDASDGSSPRGTHVGVFNFNTDSIKWDSFLYQFQVVPEQDWWLSTIWADPIDLLVNQQGNILLLTQGNTFGSLLKCYSPQGEPLWHRWIYFRDRFYEQNPREVWNFEAMVQKDDGSIVMVGQMVGRYDPILGELDTVNNSRTQAFVLQLDSLGCFEPGCEQFSNGLSIFTDLEENWQVQQSATELLVFPNPATDWLQFMFLTDHTGQLPSGTIVTVYDIEGRLQFDGVLTESNQLDISQLKPGSYAVRVLIPGVGVKSSIFIKR